MYGLIRKTAPLGAIEGLALETAVLFVPAVVYLVLLGRSGGASFGHAGVGTSVLLALTGPVTAIPLMLFAAGARRITMTSLGLLHYVAPTLQFLLGVFLYGESFTMAKLVGFTAVWIALALYTAEGIGTKRADRRRRRAASLPEPPR